MGNADHYRKLLNREYYRKWRRDNSEHLKKYHRERRKRLHAELPLEEREYLTAFRESKGMNKTRFAREMGVSPAYISNMENGYAKICHAKIRETFPDY